MQYLLDKHCTALNAIFFYMNLKLEKGNMGPNSVQFKILSKLQHKL